MKPKEKARDLIIKFAFKGAQHEGEAKTFALIAVDEILTVVKFYEKQNCRLLIDNMKVLYWQEVKQEINNL